jgi:hypothetical protein
MSISMDESWKRIKQEESPHGTVEAGGLHWNNSAHGNLGWHRNEHGSDMGNMVGLTCRLIWSRSMASTTLEFVDPRGIKTHATAYRECFALKSIVVPPPLDPSISTYSASVQH